MSTVTLWGARLRKVYSESGIVHLLGDPFTKLDLPGFCESIKSDVEQSICLPQENSFILKSTLT